MTEADPKLPREIFGQALGLPPAERTHFVDQQCGGNLALRDQVWSLLKAYEAAGDFLGSPTEAPTIDQHPSRGGTRSSGETVGSRIGPYKILQQIGEGGFGSVYMAEQQEPVIRKVALKIIKLGMDTRQVIARFEAERQALAMMDHPHIARVLDAGATEQGRPYFVMELVKGDPIVEYCDRHNLSIPERLELFAEVCTAVQHAHTKGIIHRDIKPSNILVSMLDGRPSAKVIDFGIAKATNARLTERTLFTEHRQLIGTPEYMSPEQAEGSLDIDTRSDVYSLGVLLYELLTGSTPFDSKQLRSAAFGEIQRIIREVDPPNPSTRLSQNTETIASVAASRHTEPKKLGSIVRGELDWIVMKALEKDRQRRYETANGLAMDIRRYLGGEAVVAAPPSASYRFKKFVRRNRGVVLSGTAVAAALLIGVIAFAWQAKVAREQRDLAVAAKQAEAEQRQVAESERSIAQTQRNLATQEAARATAMNSFMQQMLLAADPQVSGSRDVTVLELLNKASAKATRTLKDQPLVEASARTLMGNTFRSIDRIEEATAELTRALELRTGADAESFAQAETLRAMGMVREAAGDRLGALERFEQAQAIALKWGDEHAHEVAVGYHDLARTYLNLSRFPESEAAINSAEEWHHKTGRNDPEDRAHLLSSRAALLSAWKGDYAQAEALDTEALAIMRTLNDPYRIAESLNNVAVMRMSQNKLDEARPLYEEAIEITKKNFGDHNQRVAIYTENLANIAFRQKDYALAQSMLEQVLTTRSAIFGAESMAAARTRMNMASIALSTGDFARSLELLDAVIPVFRASLGERNLDTAVAIRSRGMALKGLNDLDGALREFQDVIAIHDEVAAPNAAGRIRTLIAIVEVKCLQGKAEEARTTADLALKALDPAKPAEAKWIKDLQDQLAKCDGAVEPSP